MEAELADEPRLEKASMVRRKGRKRAALRPTPSRPRKTWEPPSEVRKRFSKRNGGAVPTTQLECAPRPPTIEQPHDQTKYHCPDQCGCQGADDPPTEMKSESAAHPAADKCADNADDDVNDDAKSATVDDTTSKRVGDPARGCQKEPVPIFPCEPCMARPSSNVGVWTF